MINFSLLTPSPEAYFCYVKNFNDQLSVKVCAPQVHDSPTELEESSLSKSSGCIAYLISPCRFSLPSQKSSQLSLRHKACIETDGLSIWQHMWTDLCGVPGHLHLHTVELLVIHAHDLASMKKSPFYLVRWEAN